MFKCSIHKSKEELLVIKWQLTGSLKLSKKRITSEMKMKIALIKK